MTNSEHPLPGEGRAARQRGLDRQRQQLDADRPAGRLRRGMFSGEVVAAAHAPGWEQRPWTSRLLHRLGSIAAHSGAGVLAVAVVVVWAVVGIIWRFADWWQTVLYSVTGSVTFVMVFVIQHTQERQTSATQRKLDELIRSSSHADNALIAVEETSAGNLQALVDLNLSDRDQAAGSTDDQ